MSAKLKVASLLRGSAPVDGSPLSTTSPWFAAFEEVRARLFRLEQCIAHSNWASLPELTNRRGMHCAHGCPAQAWSVGCVLETLYTLNELMGREERGGG